MFSRGLALIPSIPLEAALKLIAMLIGASKLGMCYNSTPSMFRMYDRTQSVGSLA